MVYVQPLDFQNLLIGTLSGSSFIFMILALIAISFVAARLRMNNILFGIMVALFVIIMGAWLQEIYAFGIVIIGIAVFYIYSKIPKGN